jgi:catalase (peroxidase I)
VAEQRDQTPPAETVEARLARLKAATERIPARPDFTARVMRATRAPRRQGLAEVIVLASRRAIALAAVAAAASVALSLQTTRALDAVTEELTAADDLDPSFFTMDDVAADLAAPRARSEEDAP